MWTWFRNTLWTEIIGGSLSKLHIDHNNDSRAGNNYIWPMYHSSYICCTHVPETYVLPEMLRAFQYIDVLTCITVKTPRTELLVVCCEDYRWRQVDEAQTHDINRLSLLRQWSCSGQTTSHRTCVKQPMGWLYVLLFCDTHIDIGMTVPACMLIVGCWAVQCRYITGTAGSYRRSIQKLCNWAITI